ncbi:DUF885 domain-containing protein [Neiella marina]|uniref:DUF885 domain-containing protein n=1 Tax=Neiella holothuriorum TaxID=2870530 RepID=A0ABS7EF59_9GAMM|nr:DUF885 domain-containing protein [Neiella holothuriorum]MBW8190960.1 DUF885 domain-containing protein [Neiella holothuriorum]
MTFRSLQGWQTASVVILSLLLLACGKPDSPERFSEVIEPVVEQSAEQILGDVIAGSWQFQLNSFPMSAAYMGRPDQMALNDMSELSIAGKHLAFKDFLQQAKAIAREQLPAVRKIDLDILIYQLQDRVDYYDFNQHLIPITAESGFHNNVVSYLQHRQLKTVEQAEAYLAALAQIPDYFSQQQLWLEKGLAQGITQPKLVLKGFEHSISAYDVEQGSEHVLYQPLTKLPEFISSAQQAELQQKGLRLIEQQVIPAFAGLYEFFVDRYIPNARDSIAVSDTPDGADFYANRVRHYTTRDLTVEQVHQLGLEEVDRIRQEMQQIINELAFDGDFAAFLQFLRTDSQFYATSPKELLKQASWIAKKADAQLPKFFHLLPRTPYGVEPVPDSIAPKYTTGRYVSPRNDKEPGLYWVNTHALDKRPLYVLEALTLHEAVPGHHLQISLNQEMTELLPFRTHSYISAFGEGWGLYSEWLGLEMGFYQTPYDNFGRLSYEMWRALRLVVDTGMHAKGWTRQQAIDYMAENSALSLHNITTEVDRYISWPGQALSYKVGEITIKQLRQQTEQALGADFDVREFHHQILRHGSVPLSVLEDQIGRYIDSALASKTSKAQAND